MAILRYSFMSISKFKVNHITSCCGKFSFFQSKISVLHNTYSPLILSAHRCLSIRNPYKVNSISTKNGKMFKERENLYAHKIMENLSQYTSSLLKHPLSMDIYISDSQQPSDSNAIAEFVKVTVQNLFDGLTLENSKFTYLVERVCSALPGASDENIKEILHYLCMWPPSPSTMAPNFKILWNMLDRECVKRMNRWNAHFHRKLSKMAHRNAHLVFVYGTLKKGEPNHNLIEKRTEGTATFIGNAKTVKKWPLIIASRYNIPYLLYSEGKGMHVSGEVYEVDDIMLAKLDELECHPQYYTRLIEDVQMIPENEGKVLKLWIYFLMNFRTELLDLPCLSNYSSEGSHGLKYVSSEETSNPEDVYT